MIWRCFPLDREAPVEGEKLEAMLLRKGLLMPVGQIVDWLQATAASYGVAMGEPLMNYSTRLIQELGLWAQQQGRGPAFQAEGFRAYFVGNLNVADPRLLLELVRRAGLDAAAAAEVLASRSRGDQVDADWNAAEELEIVAAPTYLMAGERLVGAQSYEKLEAFVVSLGAQPVDAAE